MLSSMHQCNSQHLNSFLRDTIGEEVCNFKGNLKQCTSEMPGLTFLPVSTGNKKATEKIIMYMYQNAQTFFLGVCADLSVSFIAIILCICLQYFSCMVTTVVTNKDKV
ncbi:hypothetical protein XELAEV_18042527mg [Xenopus laevis]|uniref:Uncharacterized protein n=1 Tax=Xenopus laevis TaxID=8355 RepID=A0A974C3V5_XENLA|nr:hypothetical protein XELAEV_18042527mg [Xenopus laevis]